MKQTVLALAFVAIAFASCKQQTEAPVVEETTPTETVSESTPVILDMKHLVGAWTLPNGADASLLQGFELKEDGTMSSIKDKTNEFTKWKMVDNTVIFETAMVGTDSTSVKSATFTYEMTDQNTLKLTANGVTEVFTKQ
ncbi:MULTISPECIES: lipocalin family protein [Myroides]|uniref:lipocalin family protein n=1 Tax=Myroides TaxID=76831 RepID=UPI00209688E6|nr:lipocalin family protein [Myroides odoratimimus]MCO7721815.1 lipocalin family protein [Myroides odoratimimus]